MLPMSYFTKEALHKFQELCAEDVDFGEGPVYDFVMCLEPSGDIYGIEPGEKCEVGKQISDSEAAKLRGKKEEAPNVRMAKLKKAFLKKMGRDMTKEELTKASWMVNKGK
jgi:hypothetical protein